MSDQVIDDSRGRRVLALRKRHEWTQEALGIIAGLQRTEIIHIEKGRNKATSAEVVARLAVAFGLTVPQMMSVLDGSLATEEAYELRNT